MTGAWEAARFSSDLGWDTVVPEDTSPVPEILFVGLQ